jgi:hypothetical protein
MTRAGYGMLVVKRCEMHLTHYHGSHRHADEQEGNNLTRFARHNFQHRTPGL